MNARTYRWLLIVVTKLIYSVNASWITGNLCWSMPCLNGGSCFGSAYTYICVCPNNYSGALCEKRLGICQESPCGNRGLCVETGLTSFECRCYFDYMGPLCEEHVPKSDNSLWSSLIPVHTRVLLDILQNAYRPKAHGKSVININNSLIDPTDSTTSNAISNLPHITTPSLSDSISTTEEMQTTQQDDTMQSENVELENNIHDETTMLASDSSTQISVTDKVDNSQTADYNNETYLSTNSEVDTTPLLITLTENDVMPLSTPLMTIGDIMTISTEQNQVDSIHMNDTEKYDLFTEQSSNAIMSSTATNLLNDYTTDDNMTTFATENKENFTEQTYNDTTLDESLTSATMELMDYVSTEAANYLYIQTTNSQLDTSEQTVTTAMMTTESPLTTATSNDVTDNYSHQENAKILYRLCQQLLTHILPNMTQSSSSSASAKEILALTDGSSNSANNSADVLINWIKEKLTPTIISSIATATTTATTTSTTTTTTTATTTITTTSTTTTTTTTLKTTTTARLVSLLPSLLLNERKLSSNSLQRVDMSDILYQMRNNIDGTND